MGDRKPAHQRTADNPAIGDEDQGA